MNDRGELAGLFERARKRYTMTAIIERSGLPRGTVYRLYHGRQDSLHRNRERMRATLREMLDD